MSLVGTRPPTLDEWEKYEPHHRARMSFRPGLTGLWQVSGRSNITDFEEVVKLDTKYISEWSVKKVIKTPFIVINADDYYGKEGFKAVHEYLVNGGKSCMAGFVLKNTLSDNGGVTRGICKMDENGNLLKCYIK